jgi:hypothetical protein
VGAGAPPLARLAELGVARVSFAGFLMNRLYGAHEAKLSEIAADLNKKREGGPDMISSTTIAKVGSREEWLAAREQLLAREKEHTRLGDELARQRRELPRVPVEKDYRFDTDNGEKALVELFDW